MATSTPGSAAELSIAAPRACAIANELSARATRALGQPLESAGAVRCTIHIARSGGAYAARMEIETIGSSEPSRLRSFVAPTCDRLTETLALAVVLAVGAGPKDHAALQLQGSAPAAGPPATDEPTAQTSGADVADTPPTIVPAESTDGAHVEVQGALVADAGTLPGVGLGASIGVLLGWNVVSLQLLGTYLPAREASIQTSAGSPGVELGLLAGSLLACAPGLLTASELRLGLCAGAELGWREATGTGANVSLSSGRLWSAARADAEARWSLGRGVGLALLLSALAPLQRDELSIAGEDEGEGRVFRTGAVVGRASIGLSFALEAAAGARR